MKAVTEKISLSVTGTAGSQVRISASKKTRASMEGERKHTLPR